MVDTTKTYRRLKNLLKYIDFLVYFNYLFLLLMKIVMTIDRKSKSPNAHKKRKSTSQKHDELMIAIHFL
jgi:hypothetical protein